MDHLDVLSHHILKKSLVDCSIDELKRISEQYPYFGAAHFLLLKKLDPSGEEYKRLYQKAILYFNDPLSFSYFLNRNAFVTAVEDTIDQGISNAGVPVSNMAQPAFERKEEKIQPSKINTIIPEVSDEGIFNIEFDEATEIEQQPAIQQPENEEQPIIKEKAVNDFVAGQEKPASKEEEINISIAKPASMVETALAFEPYHTVDYFASQGIKLSQEQLSSDKFGKQLKSFTEWLKTMKKLPAAEKNISTATLSDPKVENLAQHSVEETDIFTEAMAEVWLKQGNREKAIEIYNKLSLQNPSKSPYFAAKIQNLNA